MFNIYRKTGQDGKRQEEDAELQFFGRCGRAVNGDSRRVYKLQRRREEAVCLDESKSVCNRKRTEIQRGRNGGKSRKINKLNKKNQHKEIKGE